VNYHQIYEKITIMHMRQDRDNKGPLAYKVTRVMWDDNVKGTPPQKMGKKDGMNCKCPLCPLWIVKKILRVQNIWNFGPRKGQMMQVEPSIRGGYEGHFAKHHVRIPHTT
jgi:hypothetical protein